MKMPLRTTTGSLALGLMLGLGIAVGVGPATAQTSPGTQAPAMVPPSEQKLDAFAEAVAKVNEIGEGIQAEAAQAGSEADLQRLQLHAETEMVQAVEEEGLSVEEYNMIYEMAQMDPELGLRVQELIRDKHSD
jgi:hypothetical protein